MKKNCLPLACAGLALLLFAAPFVGASEKQSTATGLGILVTEPGARCQASDRSFKLDSGTALLETRAPLIASISDCSIEAASGVAMLLSLSPARVGCCTNLTEKSDRSITVKFGDSSLKLAAGRQAWFGPTEAAVAAAIKEEPGRPTLVRQHKNAAGVIAEFSISPVTLLDTSVAVAAMKESTNPQERKLYDRIVKTSAALTMTH